MAELPNNNAESYLTCSRCGYTTAEKTTVRCPRCFQNLLPLKKCCGNCKKCAMNKKCS